MASLWLLNVPVAPLSPTQSLKTLRAMTEIVQPQLIFSEEHVADPVAPSQTLTDLASDAALHGPDRSLDDMLSERPSQEDLAEIAASGLFEPAEAHTQRTAILLFTSSGVSASTLKCVETPHGLWTTGCSNMLRRLYPGGRPEGKGLIYSGWAPFSHMMG